MATVKPYIESEFDFVITKSKKIKLSDFKPTYETKQTKYTFHYHWIDSNGFADESYKTEESISTSNQLIINWGTSGSWDNGRYLYDGNWEADGLNFQYKREMIIGFSKK